jgi:hypothetical protein
MMCRQGQQPRGRRKRVQPRFKCIGHFYNHNTTRKLSWIIIPFDPPFPILNDVRKKNTPGSKHGWGTQKDCFILYSLGPFI